MRGRGLKTRRSRKNYNHILIFFFLIAIPVIAVFIGSKITERVVIPALYSDLPIEEDLKDIINNGDNYDILNNNTDGDNLQTQGDQNNTYDSQEIVYSNLLPISLYTIQVASLSNPSNIEEFVQELNEKKLPHLIYKIDNNYKVYTLGLTNRGFVEEQLPYIREYYPDAYISEIHLPERQISYPKSRAKISEDTIRDFNSLIEIMDKQAKEWYNFINKKSDLNEYKELLLKQQIIIQDLLVKIKQDSLPIGLPQREVIEKIILYQENNINKSIEILEMEEENIYRLHSLFLDSLFRILEAIK